MLYPYEYRNNNFIQINYKKKTYKYQITTKQQHLLFWKNILTNKPTTDHNTKHYTLYNFTWKIQNLPKTQKFEHALFSHQTQLFTKSFQVRPNVKQPPSKPKVSLYSASSKSFAKLRRCRSLARTILAQSCLAWM